jgi:hypothetical protein
MLIPAEGVCWRVGRVHTLVRRQVAGIDTALDVRLKPVRTCEQRTVRFRLLRLSPNTAQSRIYSRRVPNCALLLSPAAAWYLPHGESAIAAFDLAPSYRVIQHLALKRHVGSMAPEDRQ